MFEVILRSGILFKTLLRSFMKLLFLFPFVQWIKTQTVLTGEIKRINSLFIKSKISFNSCYIIPCRSTFTSWGLLVDPWLTHTCQSWARSRCASGRTRGTWARRIERLSSDPNRKAFGVWLTGSNREDEETEGGAQRLSARPRAAAAERWTLRVTPMWVKRITN